MGDRGFRRFATPSGLRDYHGAMDAVLDNPIWSSLRTRHRNIARVKGTAARYPPDYAPFLGVAGADDDVEGALASLVAPDQSVLLIGIAPGVSPAWRLERLETLAQMVCTTPVRAMDGPEIVALGAAHRADVLALTALVYPHYFRRRTMELGRYFGVYRDGRLAAMAGERMGTDVYTELSAICTHPDFTGRGYAHRLIAFLTRDVLARGLTPFLHVSYANPHAKSLYEDLGYRLRRELPFWSLRRDGRVSLLGTRSPRT